MADAQAQAKADLDLIRGIDDVSTLDDPNRIKELEDAINRTNVRSRARAAELADEREKVQRLTGEVVGKIRGLEAELAKATSGREASDVARAAVETELAELRKTQTANDAELERLKEDAAKVAATIGTITAARNSAITDATDLRKQQKEASDRAAKAEQDLADATRREADLRRQFDELTEIQKQTLAQVDAITAERGRIREELSALQAAQAELQRRANAGDAVQLELTRVAGERDALQKQLADLQAAQAGLRGRADEATRTSDRIGQELTAANERANNAEARVEQAEADLQRTSEDLRDARRTIAAYETQRGDLQTAVQKAEETRAALQRGQAQITAQIEELRKQVAEAEAKANAAAGLNNALLAQVQTTLQTDEQELQDLLAIQQQIQQVLR